MNKSIRIILKSTQRTNADWLSVLRNPGMGGAQSPVLLSGSVLCKGVWETGRRGCRASGLEIFGSPGNLRCLPISSSTLCAMVVRIPALQGSGETSMRSWRELKVVQNRLPFNSKPFLTTHPSLPSWEDNKWAGWRQWVGQGVSHAGEGDLWDSRGGLGWGNQKRTLWMHFLASNALCV